MSYLRELWHAYQTQEVSGGDALLLLTQRPMDATSTPPPGMPVGPQAAPIAPAAPATEVPPDAPAVRHHRDRPPGPRAGTAAAADCRRRRSPYRVGAVVVVAVVDVAWSMS